MAGDWDDCGMIWGRSSALSCTTIPLLLHGELRRLADMPLTTTCSGPLAAGTTVPPGHMQKE